MLAADDFPQRRAGFAAAPLWVTAYDPKELDALMDEAAYEAFVAEQH